VDESRCKSCGAEILWARTSAGKRVPLDAKPQRLFVRGVGLEGGGVVLRSCFTSHFATCPDAAQHRRPRSTKRPERGS
jgi:hypothetical protein